MEAKEYTDVDQNLTILSEECAEVIQVAAKVRRFGIDDYHPKEQQTNRALLQQELGDILAMIDILKANGILTDIGLEDAKKRKLGKLGGWYKF